MHTEQLIIVPSPSGSTTTHALFTNTYTDITTTTNLEHILELYNLTTLSLSLTRHHPLDPQSPHYSSSFTPESSLPPTDPTQPSHIAPNLLRGLYIEAVFDEELDTHVAGEKFVKLRRTLSGLACSETHDDLWPNPETNNKPVSESRHHHLYAAASSRSPHTPPHTPPPNIFTVHTPLASLCTENVLAFLAALSPCTGPPSTTPGGLAQLYNPSDVLKSGAIKLHLEVYKSVPTVVHIDGGITLLHPASPTTPLSLSPLFPSRPLPTTPCPLSSSSLIKVLSPSYPADRYEPPTHPHTSRPLSPLYPLASFGINSNHQYVTTLYTLPIPVTGFRDEPLLTGGGGGGSEEMRRPRFSVVKEVGQGSVNGEARVEVKVRNRHGRCRIGIEGIDLINSDAFRLHDDSSLTCSGCDTVTVAPDRVQFSGTIGPESDLVISYTVAPLIRNVGIIQPNINNGEDAGEAVIYGTWVGKCSSSILDNVFSSVVSYEPQALSHEVRGTDTNIPLLAGAGEFLRNDPYSDIFVHPPEYFWLYSNSAIINVPFVDGSMPFNVITLTSTFVAFVMGTVLNVLVRKAGEGVKEKRFGKPEAVRGWKDKLKDKLGGLLGKKKKEEEGVVVEEEVAGEKVDAVSTQQ